MATEQVTQPINLEKLDCDGMSAGIGRSKKKTYCNNLGLMGRRI